MIALVSGPATNPWPSTVPSASEARSYLCGEPAPAGLEELTEWVRSSAGAITRRALEGESLDFDPHGLVAMVAWRWRLTAAYALRPTDAEQWDREALAEMFAEVVELPERVRVPSHVGEEVRQAFETERLELIRAAVTLIGFPSKAVFPASLTSRSAPLAEILCGWIAEDARRRLAEAEQVLELLSRSHPDAQAVQLTGAARVAARTEIIKIESSPERGPQDCANAIQHRLRELDARLLALQGGFTPPQSGEAMDEPALAQFGALLARNLTTERRDLLERLVVSLLSQGSGAPRSLDELSHSLAIITGRRRTPPKEREAVMRTLREAHARDGLGDDAHAELYGFKCSLGSRGMDPEVLYEMAVGALALRQRLAAMPPREAGEARRRLEAVESATRTLIRDSIPRPALTLMPRAARSYTPPSQPAVTPYPAVRKTGSNAAVVWTLRAAAMVVLLGCGIWWAVQPAPAAQEGLSTGQLAKLSPLLSSGTIYETQGVRTFVGQLDPVAWHDVPPPRRAQVGAEMAERLALHFGVDQGTVVAQQGRLAMMIQQGKVVLQ
jgi:hypothetical protein